MSSSTSPVQLTVAGGTNAIVEYIGPGARTISATGKATITNMGAEIGATTSMFPYDRHMAMYLQATGRGGLVPIADWADDLLAPDAEVERRARKILRPGRSSSIFRRWSRTWSDRTPRTAPARFPGSRPRLATRATRLTTIISTALIGSCTNSSYEDMSRAADVADQAKAHGLKAAVPFLVTPGSEQVRATIERDGQMQSLKEIGATVLANACGPCIGQWRRAKEIAEVPNTIVTSYNRNFPRRNDGQPTTMNFIASPEIVTAMALAGKLSFNPLSDTLTGADGRQFTLAPPKPAPEVPARDFDPGRDLYIGPARGWQRHRAEDQPRQRAAAADGTLAGMGRQRL